MFIKLLSLLIFICFLIGINADCSSMINQCISDCGRHPETCALCQQIMNSCYQASQNIIDNLWFYSNLFKFLII